MASSKRQTTNYNRYVRVKNALNSIYSQAIAFHLTADQINDRCAVVYKGADYQRLTRYYRGYIAGMREQLAADIWRNHVVWMLGPKDGPTRQAHTVWTEEMSLLSREKGALYGGHYWTDDNGQPTAKLFTEYTCQNA